MKRQPPRPAGIDRRFIPLGPDEEGWEVQAICAQVDPDMFFPEYHDLESWNNAKRMCAGCPVIKDCLNDGLEERFGVRGGHTPSERVRLRAQIASSPHRRDALIETSCHVMPHRIITTYEKEYSEE